MVFPHDLRVILVDTLLYGEPAFPINLNRKQNHFLRSKEFLFR